MTIKDLVFYHIEKGKGIVSVQDLTNEIVRKYPNTKWDISHWNYYRTNITSEKGRYKHLFSDEIKWNLRATAYQNKKRDFNSISRDTSTDINESNPNKHDWPEWRVPSDKEQVLLARVLLPYIKILDPEIVGLVAEDNNKHLLQWTSQLKSLSIRPDIYLWENSPVTFPGIRRHVGTGETNIFRSNPKNSIGENALYLDDNSYPKQLWSFALRNKRYGMRNPEHYSLAHILDHKDFKSRNVDELVGFEISQSKNLFAGLYTSCVNSVYIPTIFLKPTDHNSKIRKLLIQIVNKYYSAVCNALPHGLSFNSNNIEEQWQLDQFPQPAIVGNAAYIKKFLVYRKDIINERINALLLSRGL